MTLRATIKTPASELAVSVDELKAQTRVNWAEDDAFLSALLSAAIDHLERITDRAFVERAMQQSFPEFCTTMRLAQGDLIEVVSVKYRDGDDAEQTADSALYVGFTDLSGAFVTLKNGASWPATATRLDAVTIEWKAGFGAAAAVPASIKHAIKLLAAHWYVNREAVGEGGFDELPLGVKPLISPFRIMAV